MTITQIIREDKNFMNKLQEILPKPKLNKLIYQKEIILPNHNSSALAGTAFHYMFYKHFYLKYKNTFNIDLNTVLEPAYYGYRNISSSLDQEQKSIFNVSFDIYKKTEINSDSNLELGSYLFLALLESIYRSGIWNNSLFLMNEQQIINDLNNLKPSILNLDLKPKYRLELGFKFNRLGNSITKADGDLIIDNMLLDIKTSKNPLISKSMWYQIILYYLFNLHNKDNTIEYVGFIFPRMDSYILFKISDYYSESDINKALDFVTNY